MYFLAMRNYNHVWFSAPLLCFGSIAPYQKHAFNTNEANYITPKIKYFTPCIHEINSSQVQIWSEESKFYTPHMTTRHHM